MVLVDANCKKCGNHYPQSIREDMIILECPKCNEENQFVWEFEQVDTKC